MLNFAYYLEKVCKFKFSPYIYIMKTNQLKTERQELLISSEKLIKECNKMIRSGNKIGAHLLMSRIEEINKKRYELAGQILSA